MVGALVFSYSLGADLLNFGALLAFMGVNVASILRGVRYGGRQQWLPILSSLAGFLTGTVLWLNLDPKAMIVGTAWACAGVLLWIVRRKVTILPAMWRAREDFRALDVGGITSNCEFNEGSRRALLAGCNSESNRFHSIGPPRRRRVLSTQTAM